MFVEKMTQMFNLNFQTMLNSKALLRKAERDVLHEVNTFESDSLAKSWTSPDFFNAISKFLSKGR